MKSIIFHGFRVFLYRLLIRSKGKHGNSIVGNSGSTVTS